MGPADPLLLGFLGDFLRELGVGGTTILALLIATLPVLYGRKALNVGNVLSSWISMAMFTSAVIGVLLLLGVFPEVRIQPIETVAENVLRAAREQFSFLAVVGP